jgi:hypothetical protein
MACPTPELATPGSVAPADPAGLPPLREVIARYGIAARKSLGQNFILDLNLTRRIARAAGPLDHATVIAIRAALPRSASWRRPIPGGSNWWPAMRWRSTR